MSRAPQHDLNRDRAAPMRKPCVAATSAAKRADGLSIADTRGGWPSHHGISSDHREQRAFVGPDIRPQRCQLPHGGNDPAGRTDHRQSTRTHCVSQPNIGVSGDGTPRSNSKFSHRMEDHGIGSARHHVAHRGLIISRLDGFLYRPLALPIFHRIWRRSRERPSPRLVKSPRRTCGRLSGLSLRAPDPGCARRSDGDPAFRHRG